MIRRQVVVPVSPERLWEALTDPDQVAGWFGGRVAWDLEEGGAAVFEEDDGGVRLGRIERVRPGRHLRFVWWPAPAGDKGDGAAGTDAATEVSYLLEPLEEGTRLTIQERALLSPASPASPAPAGPQAAADGALAWTAWDGRLLGAWAGLADSMVAARL